MRSTDDKDNQLPEEGVTGTGGVALMVWKGEFGTHAVLPCPGEGCRAGESLVRTKFSSQ